MKSLHNHQLAPGSTSSKFLFKGGLLLPPDYETRVEGNKHADLRMGAILGLPGQGSQNTEAYYETLMMNEVADELLQMAAEALKDYQGDRYVDDKLIRAVREKDKKAQLETDVQQLLIGAHAIKIYDLLIKNGKLKKQDIIAGLGLSVGELVARCLANQMQREELFKLLAVRATEMKDATEKEKTVMKSVPFEAYKDYLTPIDPKKREKGREYLDDVVKRVGKKDAFISNKNSIGAFVLSGKKEAVDAVIEELREVYGSKIGRITPLPTAGAFHTRFMGVGMLNDLAKIGIQGLWRTPFGQALKEVKFKDGDFPVPANYEGVPILGADETRKSLGHQVDHPTDFAANAAYVNRLMRGEEEWSGKRFDPTQRAGDLLYSIGGLDQLTGVWGGNQGAAHAVHFSTPKDVEDFEPELWKAKIQIIPEKPETIAARRKVHVLGAELLSPSGNLKETYEAMCNGVKTFREFGADELSFYQNLGRHSLSLEEVMEVCEEAFTGTKYESSKSIAGKRVLLQEQIEEAESKRGKLLEEKSGEAEAMAEARNLRDLIKDLRKQRNDLKTSLENRRTAFLNSGVCKSLFAFSKHELDEEQRKINSHEDRVFFRSDLSLQDVTEIIKPLSQEVKDKIKAEKTGWWFDAEKEDRYLNFAKLRSHFSNIITPDFYEDVAKEALKNMGENVGKRWNTMGSTTIGMSLASTHKLLKKLDLVDPKTGRVPIDVAMYIGVFIASGYGEVAKTDNAVQSGVPGSSTGINYLPQALPSMITGWIANFWGISGQSAANNGACAAGAQSINQMTWLVRNKKLHGGIAGGADAPTDSFAAQAGFSGLGATTNTEVVAPFTLDHNGFPLADGVGTLFLGSSELAEARGLKPVADIVGVGESTCNSLKEGSTITNGTLSGQYRAMKEAMEDAGIMPEDIDLVIAHGTSTKEGDSNELKTYRTIFKRAKNMPIIFAPKEYYGHSLGATAAQGGAIACAIMENGVIPGNAAFRPSSISEGMPVMKDNNPFLRRNPDKEKRETAETPGKYIMVVSFGFGGTNAVYILKRHEDGTEEVVGEGETVAPAA